MIRFILLIILFLLSLLTIFQATTYHLWLIAIIISEYCLVLVVLTGILTLSGLWTERYKLAGTVLGFIVMLLFISPVLRASLIAIDLPENLSKSFGDNHDNKSPFSLIRMVNGVNKVIVPQVLKYASYSQQDLTLDFYASSIKGVRPCVIIVHGGSWKSGDNKQLPELNSYLAATGYHVAAINYRLAPKYQSPCAVQDVAAALSFLQNHACRLNIDTGKLVLLGRSAGAQIALLVAYTLKESGLKGVIDFYGPADMVWGYSVPANPLVMNSRKVMEDYLGGTYQDVPAKYEQSSPLLYVDKNSVPTLIIHGENDVLVAYEHSRRLHQKLTENFVPNYFLSLPWATHGFDYNINGPGGQLSTFAVKCFLDCLTRP